MRLFAVTLAIFGIIVTAFAQTTPQLVPQFAKFLSPIYHGPLGRVDLSSPNVSQYRTRLRNGAQQPVNFAGHYQLVQWGCGTECSAGALIDALNGQVTFLPAVVTQGMEAAMDAKFKAIEFRANSRLIVFSGQINETGVLGTHFDLWNGSGFQELLTLPFVPPATEAQQPVGGGTAFKPPPQSMSYDAQNQVDVQARRKMAQQPDFSEVKNMDAVEKSYPFLHEMFQEIRSERLIDVAQDKRFLKDNEGNHGPYIYVAESRGKINLLFVETANRYYCGPEADCYITVYADDGTGYKKAMDVITNGLVYFARTGGQVSLYLGYPNDNQVVEWVLKDHEFVENKPPPREAASPDTPPSSMTAKERAEACEFEAVGRFPSPVERQAFMKKCTADAVCDFAVQAFAAEKERYQNAVPVAFPEPCNTKDVLKSYPFLKKDFSDTDTSTVSDDTSTVSVAESRDRDANGDPINLLFVQAGPDGCGSHGCDTSVYVDYGLGYKKVMSDTIIFGLSVYRWGDSGSVSVFISSHGEAGASVVTSEFDLSGDTLAPDEFHDACYDRRQAG